METIRKDSTLAGNLACLFTIIVWGTTYISTKILLDSYTPVEILVYRFIVALIALFAAYPHRLRGTTARQELTFAMAGLCGICLYYLFENMALVYTLASNVGVIMSLSPFFTAILTWSFLKQGKPSAHFFLGFAVAMVGICLMSFAGSEIEFNPAGDLLALLASVVWGLYNVFTDRISTWGYPTILTTRRIFCYGIVFMVPIACFSGMRWDFAPLAKPVNLANLLYLGLCAGALCFVTWNFSLKVLGPIKTSIYLYAVPVVTIVAAAMFLHEQLTPVGIFGAILAVLGSILSARRKHGTKREEAKTKA